MSNAKSPLAVPSLRSMVKHGLMKYVRHVHIVHSDLYDPPNFLKKDHPRLKFVPHSKIFAGVPGNPLPTQSRNAIDSRLHHIPGLSDWFLRLDDDFFLLQEVEPTDFFRDGKMVVHGQHIRCSPTHDGGYTHAMSNSACLLAKKFGEQPRYYEDHWPTMAFRPAVSEMNGWID